MVHQEDAMKKKKKNTKAKTDRKREGVVEKRVHMRVRFALRGLEGATSVCASMCATV